VKEKIVSADVSAATNVSRLNTTEIMTDFLIGLTTTAVIVLFLEIFRSVDKKLIGAFTLAVIPFIYIGFSWADPLSLGSSIAAVALFLWLAYQGLRGNFLLIVWGLVLHGLWDFAYPFFSDFSPHGYDVFCITIDVLLAVYFYLRVETRWGTGSVIRA
jgi:hypothetical protein